MNKNWGEFAILMLTGIGIGATGIFSESTVNNTAKICSPDDPASGITKEAVQAVTAASSVALGTGISIVLFALSNKFDLLSTPARRSLFMMILAGTMITIGSISLSIRASSSDDDEKLLAQSRLGGIVLGFGLGVILIAIPKLIVMLATGGRLQTDTAHLTKVSQITVAGSTVVMSLFATIIGSWSWNIYGKCKKPATGDSLQSKAAGDAATINGVATVLSALLCVYAGIYFGFRVAGSPIADTLSNFKKAHTAAFPLKR